MRLSALFALTTILVSGTAAAQEISTMNDRLSRLERDLNYVQKQVYQGGAAPANGAAPAAPAGNQIVQIQQIQEEMRQLRGQFEQVQYTNARLQNEVKQLSEDIDYRLQAIEKQLSEPKASAEDEEIAEDEAPMEEETVEEEPVVPEENAAQYQPKQEAAPKAESKPKGFENASAHYSHAFKLMNDRKFAEASESFEQFVSKYPKDPLVANAYYWLGESYYVRSQYAKASEGFRKGFEAAPKGQKAPDNLLKLAMSLSSLKRKDQACVVLKQLISKYGNRAPDARTKAQREYGKLQCK